jgi:hypothetical protein
MTGLRRFLFALVAASALAGASWAEGPGSREVTVEYALLRDYGYFLGDLVEVAYTLKLPRGQVLNQESLAGEGPAGSPVELRSRRIDPGGRKNPEHYALRVVYQIFFTGDGTKPFEIPALRFSYGPKENPSANSSALPAIPIVVSHLASQGAPFQPPILWLWATPTPHHLRLIGLALLLGGMIPFFFWERRRLHVYSPFRAARRKISRERDPVAALILFRKALNEKAGKAIFRHNLAYFFETFPQARPYETEVQEMLGLSDEVIFNPQNSVPPDGLILRISDLAEKLRRVE